MPRSRATTRAGCFKGGGTREALDGGGGSTEAHWTCMWEKMRQRCNGMNWIHRLRYQMRRMPWEMLQGPQNGP